MQATDVPASCPSGSIDGAHELQREGVHEGLGTLLCRRLSAWGADTRAPAETETVPLDRVSVTETQRQGEAGGEEHRDGRMLTLPCSALRGRGCRSTSSGAGRRPGVEWELGCLGFPPLDSWCPRK